jgi:opacity protein-like surface antigen
MRLSHTLLAAVVTLALVGEAPKAEAQLGSLISLGAAAGLSLPRDSFNDRAKSGYNAMLTAGLHAPMIPISLRAEGMYNQFDYDESTTAGALARQGGKSASIWGFTANALVTTSAFFGPYAIGGIGYYRVNEKSPLGDFTHTNMGYNLGGGFRFALTGFSAYAEARYHWVDEGVAMIPISFGLSF